MAGLLFIGLIIFIILWGVVISLIVRGIRHYRTQNNLHYMSMGGKTPLDIAKERYAKGEISKEQFEQLKKDLL